MKFHNSNVLLAMSIITVLAVGIYTTANYLFPTIDDGSSALTYGSNTDVSFTVNPRLSISTSTDSLAIDNLVPGTTSDSNIVTITVASNTQYGYILSAGVGGIESTDPYYSTSDLIHENSTISNVFSSVDTSASLESLDTDNTWGYSTSIDGGTNWSTYSGLSNTATKPLLDISDPATPSTIDFKIAARSAPTQASGTYNNVITFYAVGKPRPIYMQEPEVIKAELQNVGDELQAIDQRDNKKYWVAKQADGNIWMTQNLDLCIGCNGTSTLTSRNTDLNEMGSGIYAKGYTNVDGVITWSSPSTITSNTTINGTSVSPAFGYRGYSYSAEGGDIYIYTSNSTDNDTIYNSLEECVNAGHTADLCSHYHIGNYYNPSAAVASSNTDGLPDRLYESANSICPAGWRLPKALPNSASSNVLLEFNQLLYVSNITTSITNGTYTDTGSFNIRTYPLYLVRGGDIYSNSLYGRGNTGKYWSSMSSNVSGSYQIGFGETVISPSKSADRSDGASVRCLLR